MCMFVLFSLFTVIYLFNFIHNKTTEQLVDLTKVNAMRWMAAGASDPNPDKHKSLSLGRHNTIILIIYSSFVCICVLVCYSLFWAM